VQTLDPVTTYEQSGYAVARQILPHHEIDQLLADVGFLQNELAGTSFAGPHDPATADLLARDHDFQSRVYDGLQAHRPVSVVALAEWPALVDLVREILKEPLGLFSKIPLRVDVPFEIKELAVWHQDFRYVQGTPNFVTAWIPLQDTNYLNGCLSVMPGSHLQGPIEHDAAVLGKRHFPSTHLDGEIRLVPVDKGDVVLFHSCLLHSGAINMSPAVRYSLQARYTPLSATVDPSMGDVTPL
jgi:ectoine hydroxylase-related dioxygenase (phytanoyl-CoA dioxygenase family)